MYFNPKELPVSRLKCLEAAEENPHKRRQIEEKKENLGSHPCVEKEIAPIGSPDENFGTYAFLNSYLVWLLGRLSGCLWFAVIVKNHPLAFRLVCYVFADLNITHNPGHFWSLN